MRKTSWISLAIGIFIAGVLIVAEWRRDVYFGRASTQEVTESAKATLDYRLASGMQHLEWAAFDWRFKLLGKRTPHPDVVILAIDEKSLKELHQWPWPRSIHASLIDRLSKNPPKALAFDVLFLEPFTMDPAGDRALVRETKKNPWVVHSYFFDTTGDVLQQIHLPFPDLLEVTEHAGYVNAFIDEDGVLRSARGQVHVQGQTISILSLEAASLYLGQTPEEVLKRMPQDPRGRMILNFVGRDYTFPYVPYADVLSGKYPADQLAGKIVLVGSNATGTFDHYPTPTSSFMPGVEFHANIIDNILRVNSLRPLKIQTTWWLVLVFAVLGSLIFARCSAQWGAGLVIGLGLGFFGLIEWLLGKRLMIVDMAGPLVALIGVYGAIVIYRFFTEEKEKRLVKTFFSQQVSAELLDVLMENPDVLKKAGERREMTVFFSDVAGFTSISERLQPEELVDLLNRYLTSMTEVIFKHGGYVDKYMGDGIMAFWNGLLKQPDHAERACRCALESMKRLNELNEDLKRRGLVPLGARIGVNTGDMAAGYMGSAQKKQFTVMGDNVNLGSRLEGANKAYGTSIMISEFTYEVVQHSFDVRFLDRILVPGKAKPVRVYELLCEKGGMTPEWQKALPIYHDAIQLYMDRGFAKAREKFLEVLSILGQDKASMAYVQRTEAFIAHPPPEGWNGVYEVKSK